MSRRVVKRFDSGGTCFQACEIIVANKSSCMLSSYPAILNSAFKPATRAKPRAQLNWAAGWEPDLWCDGRWSLSVVTKANHSKGWDAKPRA